MSTVPMRRNWRRLMFVWFGLPVLVLVGVLGAVDLVLAWKAQQGQGTAGTFTATRQECHRSCSFYGDWVSADGHESRKDVILYDEPDSLRLGGSVDALDTGAREGVFAKGGNGLTLALVAGFTLVGVAAVIALLAILVVKARKRVARKETQQGTITYR